MSRTLTIASLRPATIGAAGKPVINVLELLDDLLAPERLRLLALVRLLRAGVDLELLQLLTTQRVLGEHSLDGELHDSLRLGFQQLPDRPLRQATRVAECRYRNSSRLDPDSDTFSALTITTKSPVSTCGANCGLCFPRSSVAA